MVLYVIKKFSTQELITERFFCENILYFMRLSHHRELYIGHGLGFAVMPQKNELFSERNKHFFFPSVYGL